MLEMAPTPPASSDASAAHCQTSGLVPGAPTAAPPVVMTSPAPAAKPGAAPAPAPAIADAPAPATTTSSATPTRWVALGGVVVLLLLVAWQTASDRWVPYSARGAVSGYVAQLTPRVAGQVIAVAVHDGAEVRAGDVLAQLDPTPFDLAERQAEAALAKAAQSTRAAATGIQAAQAGVTAARAQRDNVLATNARTTELVTRGFLSAVKSDDARNAQRNADAQLQRAEAELERALIAAGGTGPAISPEMRVAQLQLERAQLDRRFATLIAPTHGVVTNLRLAVGQYVAPGTPAMTFIDARGAWVTVDLRENQLGHVKVGDEVGVVFDAAPGQVFKGHVQSLAWGIDIGRASPGGLLQNLPEGQWFEPARRIPVHIDLDNAIADWPQAARIGGKAGVLIYATGRGHPMAWLASGMLQLRSWLSFLY